MHAISTYQVWRCSAARWLKRAIALGMALALTAGGVADAAPVLAGTTLRNVAAATYIPAGSSQLETVNSNAVVANVSAVEALTLTESQTVTRPPGAQVTLSHVLTNSGNMPSSYTFNWSNNGPGCATDTLDLSALSVVRDVNNNGYLDAGDVKIALTKPDALQLLPGDAASLLVQGSLPVVPNGNACAVLSVVSGAQGQTATNVDVVNVGEVAVLHLTKSASYSGPIVPESSRIDFSIAANNIGALDASPTATAAPDSLPVLVNRMPTKLVLIRDVIPSGLQYIVGTLQGSTTGALRLYRLPGDPAFSYRTTEDASAIEVAIGLPAAIVRNGSLSMQFGTRVLQGQFGDIWNIAQAYYADGVATATSANSNTVVIAASGGRIGVAKAAGLPRLNRTSSGVPDGTGTITFSVVLRNYGKAPLHDVKANDVLEGTGATQFGSYTSNAAPATGEYTVVPGSIKIVSGDGGGVSVNSAFDGTIAQQNLLGPRTTLSVGSEVTIQFDVRVNLTGRGTLQNTVHAESSLAEGGAVQVVDDSVNGANPDADGDGNPNNDASATLISMQQPKLSLTKTASQPRRITTGVYEIDYAFIVSNTGEMLAPNVRVVDNFDCAFDMDRATGAIASWQIVGMPTVKNGLLTPSRSFTGQAACDRSSWDSADPFKVPVADALSMVDGMRSLGGGQTEEVRMTLRVTEKATSIGSRVTVDNKSWAVVREQATGSQAPSNLLSATVSTVQTLLVEPQGTVYDALSRLPIAGATVTFTRQTCSNGQTAAISVDEVFGGRSGIYVFNADGSISMTTGADGGYQFYMTSLSSTAMSCTYAITVMPPAGTGYGFPSQLLSPRGGPFATCGPVVPSATIPQAADPTTYYLSITSGFTAEKSACDVTHNHIPLDPASTTGLVLRKEGSKRQVEFGDFIDYALTVSNKSKLPMTGLLINDDLPPGFAYIAGSTRVNGAVVQNPGGGSGPRLVWAFSDLRLEPESALVLRYRVRVGVGASTSGDATNRAVASSGKAQSNLASWTVRVTGGVFSDDAFAFGKVYLDCRSDRRQDGEDEPGIPGVRLYMEDGTNITTDVEGKWSLYGLKPVTHVLRVDQSTLPPGAMLVELDNRNVGNPASRFVDLKKGELHKANFAVGNCESPELLAEVAARRQVLRSRPDLEGEAAVRTRLDPQGRVVPVGDARGLPASGMVNGSGITGSTAGASVPLIQLPTKSTSGSSTFIAGVDSTGLSAGTLGSLQQGSSFDAMKRGSAVSDRLAESDRSAAGGRQNALSLHGQRLLTPASPSPVDLETVIVGLDNALAFIELKSGDRTMSQSINVRVKGPIGVDLRLQVNGKSLEAGRVGKKATMAASNVVAWEYIGVVLHAGENRLRLEAVDSFGNVRGDPVELVIFAPDKLGVIAINLPEVARADPRTPIPIVLRLTDEAGLLITTRTHVTLEATSGRWIEEDLNPTEPGLQVFVERGGAELHLLPPEEPGDVRIRATAGSMTRETRLSLLPNLRPMIAVGIVEGTLDLTKRGKLSLGETPAGAAFENELHELSDSSKNVRAGARGAVFLKGTIKGEYLLTAAADTDKSSKERLFRDIRPDEFYPVYGDSSVRGFEAQSTRHAYVRIDKDRSYLLYGDFITSSSHEVRQLSQTNRTLTGVKQVYESSNARISSYASRTSQTQQVEEFAARGISGPYYLAGGLGDLLTNSERVEIVVRDRSQPSIVLQATAATRFVDYTIEPLSKRILFTRPISSVDANLNPQSVRVTYEVDTGGTKYTVAGTDAQVKFSDQLQLGLVTSIDQNPENQRKLLAGTAVARVGEDTSVAGEIVSTHSDLKGNGSARRFELRHQDERIGILAQATKTDPSFDNPGATFSSGRTEAVVRSEYKFDALTQLRGQALYSEDALINGARRGAAVSIQRKLNNGLVGEVGLRYGTNSSASASMFDYNQVSSYNGAFGTANVGTSLTTLGTIANNAGTVNSDEDLLSVRGRLTAQVPNVPQAQVFIEGEQDLRNNHKHMAALGGTYSITESSRVYGRYEFLSTLEGDFGFRRDQSRNVGIVGVESGYMEGGRIYNEYRLADSIDGRTGQAAMGIRNTFKLTDQWRATAGIERTRTSGSGDFQSPTSIAGLGDSTAVVSGLEYIGNVLKATGVIESRKGDDSDTVLANIGAGFKISDSWSLLSRAIYSSSKGNGRDRENERVFSRQQLGIAYRPINSDTWNALARYERRNEKIGSTGNVAGAISGNAFGSDAYLPGNYKADIVSAHLNVTPVPGVAFNARVAAKFGVQDDGTLKSSYSAQLLQSRATFDLDKQWDFGFQVGVLHGSGGALHRTAGIEVGYQVYRDLWLSAGYNFVGLKDRDLTAGEYTSKGLYVRMRFKFDEAGLRLGSPESNEGAARLSRRLPDQATEAKTAQIPVRN